MKRKIIHTNLENAYSHIDVELNNGNFLSLVESRGFSNMTYRKSKTKSCNTIEEFRKPTYYVLWGHKEGDMNRRGVTQITTKSGYNVRSLSSATKHFFEFVDAAKLVEFKKINKF